MGRLSHVLIACMDLLCFCFVSFYHIVWSRSIAAFIHFWGALMPSYISERRGCPHKSLAFSWNLFCIVCLLCELQRWCCSNFSDFCDTLVMGKVKMEKVAWSALLCKELLTEQQMTKAWSHSVINLSYLHILKYVTLRLLVLEWKEMKT